MRLLYCTHCTDVFKVVRSRRECACGKVAGWHIDQVNAVASGPYIAIGFDDTSLEQARRNLPSTGMGAPIMAYFLTESAVTVQRQEL